MPLFPAAVPNLLYNLVRRDLTVRYKSTVLGFFWSFLKPLALTAIFFVVFDRILQMRIPAGDKIPFSLFLLTGFLSWNFLAGATSEAMHVVQANANLIKKVKLPLYVFPLATVCSHLVHYLLALVLLFALLIIAGLTPGPAALWMIPLIGLQFLLVLGISLVLSALNVFYRDVSSIWEVVLTGWLYATPIIYPANTALEQIRRHTAPGVEWLYLANPLAPLLIAFRRVVLYAPLGQTSLEFGSDGRLCVAIIISIILILLILTIGWAVFKKFSRQFADEL